MQHLLRVLSVAALCCCVLLAVGWQQSGSSSAQAPAAPKSPAEGYTVHVSAPHVMDGHVGGPYHHYCKVMQPDPVQIVCLIYDKTDANAPLTQVEYIQAKGLVRT